MRIAIIAALTLVFVAGCGSSAAVTSGGATGTPTGTALATATLTGPYQSSMQSNLAYGPLPSETLDLCLPVGAAGSRPGVVLIHGGGWRAGSKSGHDKDCRYLASHGFVAVTIDYRLVPTAIYPAQVVDTQLAVRWLHAHASTYQLDAQRMCSWGDSAGGYLAVALVVLTHIQAGDEAGLLANESPTVQCVVDEFGPVDFTASAGVMPSQMTTVINFLGSTPAQNPTLYHDASPLFAITAQTAPMLIVQGTQDMTVPQSQSLELQQHLQAAGVAVQYIAYPGSHEFQGLSSDQKQTIEEQMLGYVIAQEHP